MLYALILCVALSFAINVQTAMAQGDGNSSAPTDGKNTVFRPSKDQITEAQTKLKDAGAYDGEADGKYNNDFRKSIREFQEENGLSKTGNLNRATLEKMEISLTESQKLIPIPADSYAKESTGSKRKAPFRANTYQITEAQKTMRASGVYDGEDTGKLDYRTREGLKKFQRLNGVKITGTLNAETLGSMGIPLTDAQKENSN